MSEPNYTPRPCHACSGSGCDRCRDGFTVGPDHNPVPLSEFSAPMRNWAGLVK